MIAKAGKPYLILSPYRGRTGRRKLGQWKDQVWIAPDFDETSPDIIAAFEGDDDE